MRRELFQPTVEGEARLLLLIDAFSSRTNALEGRTKLAKLDFFLRYPRFLQKALEIREPNRRIVVPLADSSNIENRMVRYRFGPWDPSYFALLGRLIGKQLIQTVSTPKGLSYKVTERGHSTAEKLANDQSWAETVSIIKLLKRYMDLQGSTLKDFVYTHFPEVSEARWGNQL